MCFNPGYIREFGRPFHIEIVLFLRTKPYEHWTKEELESFNWYCSRILPAISKEWSKKDTQSTYPISHSVTISDEAFAVTEVRRNFDQWHDGKFAEAAIKAMWDETLAATMNFPNNDFYKLMFHGVYKDDSLNAEVSTSTENQAKEDMKQDDDEDSDEEADGPENKVALQKDNNSFDISRFQLLFSEFVEISELLLQPDQKHRSDSHTSLAEMSKAMSVIEELRKHPNCGPVENEYTAVAMDHLIKFDALQEAKIASRKRPKEEMVKVNFETIMKLYRRSEMH